MAERSHAAPPTASIFPASNSREGLPFAAMPPSSASEGIGLYRGVEWLPEGDRLALDL